MPKIRKSPAHLLRMGTVYHFQYSIPHKYQSYAFGEVRMSLGTGALESSRSRAAILSSGKIVKPTLLRGMPTRNPAS